MKIIKAIIILSCIIYSLQVKRVENKLESLKRAEKAQTRKAVMKKAERKIAKSLMARIFKVSIFVGSETLNSTASFDAKDIKKPIDGKVRGVYLTFNNNTIIQPSLKALLVAVPSTTGQYLPYRSLAASFKFESPAAQGKIISTTIQLGNVFQNIRIQFEYDPDWEVISSDEATTLIGWFNTLRIARIALVNQLKVAALQSGNAYYTSKVSYDAALKGAQGIDDQIKVSTIQTAALKAEIAKNDETLKALKDQVTAKEASINALSKSQTGAVSRVSQDDQYISAQNATLNTLKLQKSSGVTDASAFQATMDQSKDAFVLIVNTIREEFGMDSVILDNANKAIFNTNPPNLDLCNNFINKVTPYY